MDQLQLAHSRLMMRMRIGQQKNWRKMKQEEGKLTGLCSPYAPDYLHYIRRCSSRQFLFSFLLIPSVFVVNRPFLVRYCLFSLERANAITKTNTVKVGVRLY